MATIASSCCSEEKGWHSLGLDLQERILLLLPTSAAVKVAAVCRSWRTIVASPSFSAQLRLLPPGKKPWFFLWGINELIHWRSTVFAFDPVAGLWFRQQTSRPPDFNRASLSGMPGAFFAFAGSKVIFTPTPAKMIWKETSPATHCRCSALMGSIGSPHLQSFKFVVVGGIIDEDVDQGNTEIYTSHSNSWDLCDSLPEDLFSSGISSCWMSSAILGYKFYVAMYDGCISFLNVKTKSWSKAQRLRIPDLVSLFIVAGDAGLFAVCICGGQKGDCLKLFKVNELNMDCEEVSRMPSELFALFENEDEQKEASLKCAGSGSLVYVYSEQNYKGYPFCMCDLSTGSYVWKQLPSLPSPPRFNRVVCCSTSIYPRDCLEMR